MSSEVYSSNVGLLSFDPVLRFSSSNNTPPPSKNLTSHSFLGKGVFGKCREAFGMFQMRSHVGVSFQLTWDMLLKLQNPRSRSKCSGRLPVPHVLWWDYDPTVPIIHFKGAGKLPLLSWPLWKEGMGWLFPFLPLAKKTSIPFQITCPMSPFSSISL